MKKMLSFFILKEIEICKYYFNFLLENKSFSSFQQ